MFFSVRAIFTPNLYQAYNIFLWILYPDELVMPCLKAESVPWILTEHLMQCLT